LAVVFGLGKILISYIFFLQPKTTKKAQVTPIKDKKESSVCHWNK